MTTPLSGPKKVVTERQNEGAVLSSTTCAPALLAKIHAPLPAPCDIYVTGPEIADGKTSVPAKLIGLSCYPGEQITFWVQGLGGWLYSYLPQHYLSTHPTRRGFEERAEGGSPFIVPQHRGFAVDAPLVPTVSAWFRHDVLAMVDFMDCNELAWILVHARGSIRVLTHREFDATIPPGGLRKMRETWK